MLRKRVWKLPIFMWFIIITSFVSMAIVSAAVSAATAVLSAPVIVDTTLTSGENFYINITVANIEHLWGYQFVLYYDTAVLTATGYSFYDPFVVPWPCGINDTVGYVEITSSMMFGEEVGFSTVDPAPIARIDFTVEALGNSTLELSGLPPQMWTKLSDPKGDPLAHDVVDGFFANVVLPAHDIAVTDVAAYPTTVTAGEVVRISVMVLNEGIETETFDVTVKYDDIEIETKTVTGLALGISETLSFSWDTTDVRLGYYTIKAVAGPVDGETLTVDNTFIDGIVNIIKPSYDPEAIFTCEPQYPYLYIGETIELNASESYDRDGYIVSYFWEFGDGTNGTGMIVEHTYTEAGFYPGTLTVTDNDDNTDTTWFSFAVIGRVLEIKLSGELDYMFKERVKVRVTALVRDAGIHIPWMYYIPYDIISRPPETVSGANVTLEIYDPSGDLWVSDVMVEKLTGTGIYEWESDDTIGKLRLEKGVYLVHVKTSYLGGPIASEIQQFHIDPPAEGSSGVPMHYVIAIVAVLVSVIGLIILKRPIYSRFR